MLVIAACNRVFAVAMPIKQQHSLTISGKPLKYKVCITDFKIEDGVTFIHVAKTEPYMVGLLNIRRVDSMGQRMLSRTDLFEQLAGLRVSAFTEAVRNVSGDAGGGGDEHLQGVDDGDDASPLKRISRQVLAQVPKVVTITTPNVGDVAGIDIRILLGAPRFPLYMELTDEMVTYLQDAIHYQIKFMDLKRTRIRGKSGEQNKNGDGVGVSFEDENTEDTAVGSKDDRDGDVCSDKGVGSQHKDDCDGDTPPAPSPKKAKTKNSNPGFEYKSNDCVVALKTIQTTDRDGCKGIKRYFSAKTEDNKFSFSFMVPNGNLDCGNRSSGSVKSE